MQDHHHPPPGEAARHRQLAATQEGRGQALTPSDFAAFTGHLQRKLGDAEYRCDWTNAKWLMHLWSINYTKTKM